MDVMSDNSFESSMKCDFPVRESFREALLADLLSMDESKLASASSDESMEPHKSAVRIVKLEDADLEMLAAAEGEERTFNRSFEDLFEQ